MIIASIMNVIYIKEDVMNNILKEGLDIQKIYNVAARYYRAALKRNNSKEFCDFIQNYKKDEIL